MGHGVNTFFLIFHVMQCWDTATIDVKTDLGLFAFIFFLTGVFFSM